MKPKETQYCFRSFLDLGNKGRTDWGPLESLIKSLQLLRNCLFYKAHEGLTLASASEQNLIIKARTATQPEWDRSKGQWARRETALLPFTSPSIPSCTHWGEKLLKQHNFYIQLLFREWTIRTGKNSERSLESSQAATNTTFINRLCFQHSCGHLCSSDNVSHNSVLNSDITLKEIS